MDKATIVFVVLSEDCRWGEGSHTQPTQLKESSTFFRFKSTKVEMAIHRETKWEQREICASSRMLDALFHSQFPFLCSIGESFLEEREGHAMSHKLKGSRCATIFRERRRRGWRQHFWWWGCGDGEERAKQKKFSAKKKDNKSLRGVTSQWNSYWKLAHFCLSERLVMDKSCSRIE